jgi:ankyrin repeat protein
MKRQLPAHPNLAQLKHQAKDLVNSIDSGAEEALSRFREHHPRFSDRTAVSLSDAQLVIAREYGFASWPKLKHHVEGIEALGERVSLLRAEFAAGDAATRQRLLQPAHAKERFQNYDPRAPSLSEADARLLIANQEGYAFWQKYESYLYLDPAVQTVIAAVRAGKLEALREILHADPAAANPKWVPGFQPPKPIPNDSIPLFCVSEAIFRGTNAHGNEYEITRALIASGGNIEIAGDLVLTGAVSFNAVRVVEALLDHGAQVDGVDGDGVPMAYAMHFGFVKIAELLAGCGAKLDLRFAAGLGQFDLVKSWFNPNGSLKPGAGALADPYGFERKARGETAFRCERTPENILSQALYFACTHNRLDVAEFLLSQGADINAIVPGLDFKATVLHRVATLDFGGPAATSKTALGAPAIQFLLDHGASVEVRDQEHHGTPIGWAYHFQRYDVFDLLIDRAGIHDAVTFDRIDRLRVLLDQDRSLANAQDDLGQRPLHCLHGELKHGVEMIDLLVAHGADVNARDSNDVTVLARVMSSGAPDLAGYLRSFGALGNG